jgi:cytochrome b
VVNKKTRSLVIFIIVCIYGLVASKTYNWFMANHYSDAPTFINYILAALVLVPLFWAGFEVMDAWIKPKFLIKVLS